MMDVVYIVRAGERNESLRYSLRSIETNLTFSGKVWVVGHCPRWLTGVEHIPGNHYPDKPRNVYDNIRIASTTPGPTNQVIVMNDDFFVMQPTTRIPRWYRCDLADHIASIGAGSDWHTSLVAAHDWLTTQGITNPKSYELHKPIVVDRARMAQVTELAADHTPMTPPQWRTIYGNYWKIGGTQVNDCKVYNNGEHTGDIPFLSIRSTRAFTTLEIGARIRAAFTNPSKWEAQPTHRDTRRREQFRRTPGRDRRETRARNHPPPNKGAEDETYPPA